MEIRRRTYRYLTVPVTGIALVLATGGTASAGGSTPWVPNYYTLPSQCGAYAGNVVVGPLIALPGGKLGTGPIDVYDHSGDGSALGTSGPVSGYYQVPASTGVNVVIGTKYNDYINGSGGNDIICSWKGGDTVNGGEGNDNLYGGTNEDALYGEGGNDFIDGGQDRDSIFGDNFAQSSATDGPDTLNGGDESDYLYGGAGQDTIDGGGDTYLQGSPPDTYGDYADGQADGATCVNTETGPC
jgi:Ca2+-binding RTX toxin-like protein